MAGFLQMRQFVEYPMDMAISGWAAGDLRVVALGPKGKTAGLLNEMTKRRRGILEKLSLTSQWHVL